MITMPYSINDFSDKSLSDSLLLIQTLSNDINREMSKRNDERFVAAIPSYQEELDDSYWSGFETGITWDCEKYKYVPGGPYVLSNTSPYHLDFGKRSLHSQQRIILSQHKHKVWMNGWYAGHSMQRSAKK